VQGTGQSLLSIRKETQEVKTGRGDKHIKGVSKALKIKGRVVGIDRRVLVVEK
jgi:hypothetical protein